MALVQNRVQFRDLVNKNLFMNYENMWLQRKNAYFSLEECCRYNNCIMHFTLYATKNNPPEDKDSPWNHRQNVFSVLKWNSWMWPSRVEKCFVNGQIVLGTMESYSWQNNDFLPFLCLYLASAVSNYRNYECHACRMSFVPRTICPSASFLHRTSFFHKRKQA